MIPIDLGHIAYVDGSFGTREVVGRCGAVARDSSNTCV